MFSSVRLEPYIDPSRSWGPWHLSRSERPCSLFNVRHGYAELSLCGLSNIESLRYRVRAIAEKSWCTNRDLADLSRALAETIGFAIEVERDVQRYRAQGPVSMQTAMQGLMSGRDSARVYFRIAEVQQPLLNDVHLKLRKSLPVRR